MVQVKPKYQFIVQKDQKYQNHQNNIVMMSQDQRNIFKISLLIVTNSNRILDSEYIVFVLHYSQLPAISILLVIIPGLKLLMP